MWGNSYVPTNTLDPNKVSTYYSCRKWKTLDKPTKTNFTGMLNHQLSGGDSYPVLEFALGTSVGVSSGGAALVFSVACLGLSLSKTVYGVMARGEDEIWQVEQIGINNGKTYHVSAYFLYDPNRNKSFKGGNGWLIHEEREELTV